MDIYAGSDPDPFPRFPKVNYELAFRNTITKDTQRQILDEIYKISYLINPKIWLGIKLLSTYFNVRPNELRNIQEKHIDLNQGVILIPHPKERTPKYIFLLPEDVQILKSFPVTLNPELYFFRHFKGNGSAKPGQQFGKDYFYKWFKLACKNLGIENIDLYGGTRHSTVRKLRKLRTPEEIKLASMHSSNKAFERYFQIDANDLRNIYQDTLQSGNQAGKELANKK